ncbi:amidoligase family protein [Ferruginivarius sediminum]|uniref:Amidoligase enzyme n=1 Tax=Ferruginivarius sediminum TaxID=2661937 RepID=A0A369T7I1_9PROT|nr:amidoligase family protein [Ferruginivarius sediminum]RDD61299.1 hypothetical protein DRB17_13590 [Ferruginivarius sediminum]
MPDPVLPHFATTSDGSARRVGVEIEFGGLACGEAADVVAAVFGGEVREIDQYRYIVESEAFGPFTVELDTQYVHAGEAKTPQQRVKLESERLGEALEEGLRTAIGEVTRFYLPTEIVCPPIAIAELPHLDELARRLRAAGAEGSRDSLIYAFGLQLNPDLPAFDAGTVLSYLRAYLVSADWLRREIGIDLTRRVLPFIQPYPRAYLRHVLRREYEPDLKTLIGDYLFYNPTRNRDLDMLPLFLWLAPQQVRAKVEDPRLKARPALHYRLPDCRIDEPGWTIVGEWNRWAETVERLAADPTRLRDTCDAYLRHIEQGWLADWAQEAMGWLRP